MDFGEKFELRDKLETIGKHPTIRNTLLSDQADPDRINTVWRYLQNPPPLPDKGDDVHTSTLSGCQVVVAPPLLKNWLANPGVMQTVHTLLEPLFVGDAGNAHQELVKFLRKSSHAAR